MKTRLNNSIFFMLCLYAIQAVVQSGASLYVLPRRIAVELYMSKNIMGPGNDC